MEPSLEKRFSALEQSRKELFEQLDRLSEAQLNYHPATDAWSIVDVLNHMMTAEDGAFRYIAKKNQAASLRPSGVMNQLRTFLLKMALMSPFKFKAPPQVVKLMAPKSYSQIKQDWKNARAFMKELVSSLPPDRLKAQIFRHPFCGMINVYQTFTFAEAHFEHHRRQIARINASEGFPQ